RYCLHTRRRSPCPTNRFESHTIQQSSSCWMPSQDGSTNTATFTVLTTNSGNAASRTLGRLQRISAYRSAIFVAWLQRGPARQITYRKCWWRFPLIRRRWLNPILLQCGTCSGSASSVAKRAVVNTNRRKAQPPRISVNSVPTPTPSMLSSRRKQNSQGTNAPEVCYRLLADMSSAYEDRAAPNSNRSVGRWQLRGRIRCVLLEVRQPRARRGLHKLYGAMCILGR